MAAARRRRRATRHGTLAGIPVTAEPAAGAGDKTFQVLIVDDSAAGRRVLEAMLTDLGHLPTCCADGASAVEAFRGKPFDVVLLDIVMPGVDGLEVASQLAGWERRPAVVFTTAYDEYAIQAFDAQAVDYVVKPVGVLEFLAR